MEKVPREIVGVSCAVAFQLQPGTRINSFTGRVPVHPELSGLGGVPETPHWSVELVAWSCQL